MFITLAVPTKYVSLGSIGAAVAIPLFCLLFGMDPVATIPVFVVAAAVIWAHRENINRLNAGSESKFSFGEKKIMNYIFEDDGNVSEVIGALDIIHHLDKIAHTTQSIYKWIMYRKYGNIN